MNLALWQIVVDVAAVIFFCGAGWYMLKQVRSDVRANSAQIEALWKKHDAARDRGEARYRKTLVTLTAMAAAMPDNPGGRQRVMEMIQSMAETNGEYT